MAISGTLKMPLLRELPLDSLTGRNDTWVYSVRAAAMVDSRAFQTEIRTVPPGCP